MKVTIVKIMADKNGFHASNTVDIAPDSFQMLDGWAVLPESVGAPDTIKNYPYGDITVDETQAPPVVTSWTPLPIPEPETPTPAQLREEAYNTQAIIAWDGSMITVTQASQKWQYYAAEGNTAKTDELTALIAEAKASIREQYPDEEAN